MIFFTPVTQFFPETTPREHMKTRHRNPQEKDNG